MPAMALVCLLLSILYPLLSAEFVKLDGQAVLRGARFPLAYRVEDTTDLLKDRLDAASRVPMRDRLAVIVLFYYHLGPQEHPRLAALHCSLSKLYEHVRPHTPIDTFLFVNNDTRSFLPTWLETDFENLHVVSVDPKSWELPANLSPEHTWSTWTPKFNRDYRSMGRWRLTFGPHFAHTLGYKYFVSLDDDLYVVEGEPFATNLVDTFNQLSTGFAFRDRKLIEHVAVLEGLPELAKFWMVTRKVAAPWGPLLEQFSPSTMEAVASATWNGLTYENSFYAVNLDFWFEPPVQDFLNLVLATGSDVTQRWSEQAVMNMMRLLFLGGHNVSVFPQSSMIHSQYRDPRLQGPPQCEAANARLPEMPAAATKLDATDIEGLVHPDIRVLEHLLTFETASTAYEADVFRFAYNTTVCGEDTFTVSGIDPVVYVNFNELYPKPPAFAKELRASYERLLNTYTMVNEAGQAVRGVGCAEIVRQQLNDHFSYFCMSRGIDRPDWWLHECELNRAAVLAAHDTH